MGIPHAAIPAGRPDANGVVQVGQVVGRALGDLGLEVEALDGAGGGGEVLQAADGGCMEISWVNEMAH